ncbi:MAG TPA: MBL fold metallo-hydrolase RNA specificity domain-containing protein, partial [Patescibacteria group bacterium]
GAEVVKIEGMSSHACGPDELFGFLNYFNLSELNKVIVVHGSDRARNVLANEFKKRGYRAQVILPGLYQEVVL